jgi:type III secretion protein F
MQQMMQEWTMLTQLQSTLVKDIGDALKGIIQKSG